MFFYLLDHVILWSLNEDYYSFWFEFCIEMLLIIDGVIGVETGGVMLFDFTSEVPSSSFSESANDFSIIFELKLFVFTEIFEYL